MQYFSEQRDKILTTTETNTKERKQWLQKINQKRERKFQPSYKNPQRTTLGMEYGARQLKIVSANMDDIRSKTMLKELDIRMANMKADFARLQETHETTPADQEMENYRYISTAAQPTDGKANEKGIGGVAILIKKEWRDNIVGIARYSHRCMKIELGANIKKNHPPNKYICATHGIWKK